MKDDRQRKGEGGILCNKAIADRGARICDVGLSRSFPLPHRPPRHQPSEPSRNKPLSKPQRLPDQSAIIPDDSTFYPPDRKHVMIVRKQVKIVATSGVNLAWRKKNNVPYTTYYNIHILVFVSRVLIYYKFFSRTKIFYFAVSTAEIMWQQLRHDRMTTQYKSGKPIAYFNSS